MADAPVGVGGAAVDSSGDESPVGDVPLAVPAGAAAGAVPGDESAVPGEVPEGVPGGGVAEDEAVEGGP